MDGRIEIEVRFLNPDDGGRQQPPNLKAGTYRPHFRVPPDTTLLGVAFVDGPPLMQPNVPFRATVRPLYAPSVDYSLLTVGAHFDVVEGPKVVGDGVVIRCG
jgi:hypothetical protein